MVLCDIAATTKGHGPQSGERGRDDRCVLGDHQLPASASTAVQALAATTLPPPPPAHTVWPARGTAARNWQFCIHRASEPASNTPARNRQGVTGSRSLLTLCECEVGRWSRSWPRSPGNTPPGRPPTPGPRSAPRSAPPRRCPGARRSPAHQRPVGDVTLVERPGRELPSVGNQAVQDHRDNPRVGAGRRDRVADIPHPQRSGPSPSHPQFNP